MKYINKIVLSIVICIGGIVFFLACNYTYKSKELKINQIAKEAFVEAFGQELKSRDLGDYFSFNYNAKTLLSADIPDSVYFEDSSGRHWYQLDPTKHHMNITYDTNVRSLHSSTFGENPINSDSLNTIWNGVLQDYNIYKKSALCVSLTGYDGKKQSINTSNSGWCTKSNLTFTIYIGYACEIEIIEYLDYSLWNMMYIEILIYLLLYVVFIFIIYKISISIIVKLKSMQQIEVVQGISSTPVRSYILHDNVLFHAEQRMIEKSGVRKKIPLQACLLLELFLNSKDYIVTDTEIMNTLWPDGSGHLKRVHKAVARLRTYLMADSNIRIERENLDTYQLII